MLFGARILVVEEMADERQFLVSTLVGEGYLVTSFATGDEAVTYAARSLLPVILLFDTSHTLSAKIRDRIAAELHGVPVILSTGSESVPVLPGVDVLHKPISLARLFTAIERMM